MHQTARMSHEIPPIVAAWFVVIIGTVWLNPALAATQDPRDTEISLAIERSLLNDETVPQNLQNLIDVSTRQGIVTLTGRVPHLYAKEKAIRHAQSLKGVRAVIDQIEVTPVSRPDVEISQDVSTALLLDPATDSFDIHSMVLNGTVTLTGSVDSWAERELAESVTKGVKGVKKVKNEIKLNAKTEDRSDAEIEAEIKQRYQNDVWLAENRLDVKVEDGTVKLSGTVGSVLEKSRARARAYVLGVKGVDDKDLAVDWAAREHLRRTKYPDKTDEEIKRAVKDAMLHDPRVWSFHPRVTVTFGTVTLTGVVDNLKAKLAAEKDAMNTVGVKSVRNYLKIRPEQPIPDETVAERIRSGLLRDPLIDRFEITTTVRNGSASLFGTVDTYYEKWRAEDIASRMKGVLEVKNFLKVAGDGWVWARDWEIKDEIEDELGWSPFVDADDINVSVKDGIAILTGTVDSWWEKDQATENAYDGGAKYVRNHLLVTE